MILLYGLIVVQAALAVLHLSGYRQAVLRPNLLFFNFFQKFNMSNQYSAVPVKEGGVFKCVMPVRWGDMDAVGHVNNTLYFRYVEEARAQCFDAENVFFTQGRVPLLAHASFDFIKSVVYPATVVVIMTMTRLGRSSMTFDVAIETLDEPGVAYAKGKNVVVAAERSSGQSSPWTAAELSHLARFFV